MQRHQLLVTPPQQAGKRARREKMVERVVWGEHGWVDGWVGWWGVLQKCERVRAAEERAGIMCAVIILVYRPF